MARKRSIKTVFKNADKELKKEQHKFSDKFTYKKGEVSVFLPSDEERERLRKKAGK